MYLREYKNKEGIVIFTALSEEVYGTLSFEGYQQKMVLNNDDWKKVTVSNENEIIEYEDSEGNKWDKSYGIDFPYSWDTLTKELLTAIMSQFEVEADDLDMASVKVKEVLSDMTLESNVNEILSMIKNKSDYLRKMANECEDRLNPNVYGEVLECEQAPQSLHLR